MAALGREAILNILRVEKEFKIYCIMTKPVQHQGKQIQLSSPGFLVEQLIRGTMPLSVNIYTYTLDGTTSFVIPNDTATEAQLLALKALCLFVYDPAQLVIVKGIPCFLNTII